GDNAAFRFVTLAKQQPTRVLCCVYSVPNFQLLLSLSLLYTPRPYHLHVTRKSLSYWASGYWPKSLTYWALGFAPIHIIGLGPFLDTLLLSYTVHARPHSSPNSTRIRASLTTVTATARFPTFFFFSDSLSERRFSVIFFDYGEAEREQGMMNNSIIVHIPDKQPYDLHHQPTECVYASAIDPKHANQIVRRLNQLAPLEDLRHVKRIQKKVLEGGQIQLFVILCLAPEGNNQLDNMPPHLQEFISSYQLSPFITKVCKYAATSKEEWQEQCKFWPTSYHPRTYNIDGITGFSEEDSQSVLKFMQSAIELATSYGSVVNAAVIVDPSAKQIISSACDQIFAWNTCKNDSCSRKPELFSSHPIISSRCDPHEPLHSNSSSNELKQPYTGVSCLYPRQWAEQQSHSQNSYYCHPLQHAAIVAIESSAARDRCLFPSEGNSEARHLELDRENSSWTSSPAKRQKTVCTDGEDDDKLNAHSQTSDQPLARPYLCTGYDIYLVWEPCTMCAMALVHQRIRRIFYAFPNPNAGALGSVHRLQGEKSLNHHYAVFRVMLPEEALHKCHT
ncbi:putative inactive tRNA-specific adenosine deaminase-like protein 3, partial [Mucuna pruriens]